MVLSPEQVKAYYASQNSQARPLSPEEWLRQQNPSAIPSETQTATNAGILPARGGAPVVPPAPQVNPTDNLVEFKNTIAFIQQKARESRNAMALSFLGTASPTNPIAPDTFASVLSGLNRAGDTYAEDIQKNALKSFEPDWQTVTETDDSGRVMAVIFDRNNPATQKKVDLGKIGKTKQGDTTTSEELKQFINKEMAKPGWKNFTPEKKAQFIRLNGGTPSDFDLTLSGL